MNSRYSILVGATFGLIAVALGAFGAHALKSILLANNRLDTFELATRYLFYHSGALLLVGLLNQNKNDRLLHYSSLGFFIGVILFSGSLYTLSISNVSSFATATPVGGVFLVFGWFMLFLASLKKVGK
jgi:uncharacterized membrane protein YgdD (TMEM256/DUF423 family)